MGNLKFECNFLISDFSRRRPQKWKLAICPTEPTSQIHILPTNCIFIALPPYIYIPSIYHLYTIFLWLLNYHQKCWLFLFCVLLMAFNPLGCCWMNILLRIVHLFFLYPFGVFIHCIQYLYPSVVFLRPIHSLLLNEHFVEDYLFVVFVFIRCIHLLYSFVV